jgi:hypothetical protein
MPWHVEALTDWSKRQTGKTQAFFFFFNSGPGTKHVIDLIQPIGSSSTPTPSGWVGLRANVHSCLREQIDQVYPSRRTLERWLSSAVLCHTKTRRACNRQILRRAGPTRAAAGAVAARARARARVCLCPQPPTRAVQRLVGARMSSPQLPCPIQCARPRPGHALQASAAPLPLPSHTRAAGLSQARSVHATAARGPRRTRVRPPAAFTGTGSSVGVGRRALG